jgi:hypothetical protein
MNASGEAYRCAAVDCENICAQQKSRHAGRRSGACNGVVQTVCLWRVTRVPSVLVRLRRMASLESCVTSSIVGSLLERRRFFVDDVLIRAWMKTLSLTEEAVDLDADDSRCEEESAMFSLSSSSLCSGTSSGRSSLEQRGGEPAGGGQRGARSGAGRRAVRRCGSC